MNIAAKINNIKETNKGCKAELISKIARLVAHDTGMPMNIAVTFAASQVVDNKILRVS